MSDTKWSWNTVFPSRFLAAEEFKGRDVTLTVTRVELEKLPKEDGTEEIKPVVSFKETARQWGVNKTNAKCLRAMFGDDPASLVGQQVTLFPEPFRGGEVAIRVRGAPSLSKPVKVRTTEGLKMKIRTLVPTGKPAPAGGDQ